MRGFCAVADKPKLVEMLTLLIGLLHINVQFFFHYSEEQMRQNQSILMISSFLDALLLVGHQARSLFFRASNWPARLLGLGYIGLSSLQQHFNFAFLCEQNILGISEIEGGKNTRVHVD